MSSLLDQKHTFTKLKVKLEERKKRICQCCKRFRYLVYNYRNKKKKIKRKPIPQNKFKSKGRSENKKTGNSRESKMFQMLEYRALQVRVFKY